MTNFAPYYLKSWKAGELPPELDALQVVMVDYDQTKKAYEVRPSDIEDFIEWVSYHWGGDNSAREMGDDGEYLETAQEHLDRIGCYVEIITTYRLEDTQEQLNQLSPGARKAMLAEAIRRTGMARDFVKEWLIETGHNALDLSLALNSEDVGEMPKRSVERAILNGERLPLPGRV